MVGQFLVREDSSKTVEILFLANAASIDNIVSVLKRSPLKFNWQVTNLEQKPQIATAIDLVIYDAEFEGMSLEQAIAFFSASQQVPVIVVNGESKVATAVAAVKAGAMDYLASESLPDLPSTIINALSESDYPCFQSQCETQADRQLQKLIVENPDGIIVVDERGIVQFVNPAALELLGKSSSQLVGEALGFPVVNGDYLEVDIPIKDKILVAQMRVSRIQWQGSNGCVVSLRDITQQKQAEEERAKLLESAQAANRAKDEFLAILSHELRTPLNPIMGWSQLLVRGDLPEAQVKKGAEVIQRNAMLQTKLIEDVLDISRIIQGKLKLQISSVDLTETIKNAIETVNLAAEAKSIQIKTSLEQIRGCVKGDPTRLQQVVWNLLSNAIKFTPSGGAVKVKLSSKQDKLVSYAQIRVTDSGKGITPEFLPYVFDYFRQAESTKSRSEGGLGLGLAIAQRTVELHGGNITASSDGLGKGATFTISLPIFNESTKVADEQISQGNTLVGRKILVVDDDNDSRNLICFILETEGAEINAVSSAIEALSVIEQFQPDLVISDIGMPQMNGYELIKQIRQLSNTVRDVKAIALSSYTSQKDRQESVSAGFNDYLNKPLDINSLMNAIASTSLLAE